MYGINEIQQTMGMFGLRVGDISLTQNEDTFSKTIRDTVFVSAYPLAAWIASSWWRLIFEPLPPTKAKPSVDWRMAHELTAANQGFIWPRLILASDTELIQIWSTPSKAVDQQSVRYINGLEGSCSINLHEFERTAQTFIETVISRLNATGVHNTSLANLWQEVQEERSDTYSSQYRRCEAELGFDPDECSESLVEDTLNLAEQIGIKTLSELAPACSKDLSEAKPLSEILKQIQESGLTGNPDISIDDSVSPDTPQAPWQRGNKVASLLRDAIDIPENSIPDDTLYDLLGLKKSEYEAWTPPRRQHISVAVPLKENRFNFHPRKKHPIAKRFELARLIGDYLFYDNRGESWLTSTDLRTSRQKYQRAFAAEFLCPLSSLQDYLDSDYSESAIEDAGDHFQVSSQTVESILANNGLIYSPQSSSDLEASLPY
ncbi:ImmA/IrrE family metallo-endopeptidase [Coleofasciculus sp. G2-EDA-02]|uniref:ImmA/IrrE family metallo-endopeptidase n=1 Tax=Coleofasciculus sp. G2-EDA-02 TaxID=3069529 RepID=UPI0032F338C4